MSNPGQEPRIKCNEMNRPRSTVFHKSTSCALPEELVNVLVALPLRWSLGRESVKSESAVNCYGGKQTWGLPFDIFLTFHLRSESFHEVPSTTLSLCIAEIARIKEMKPSYQDKALNAIPSVFCEFLNS
jgi:hypothetical protein